MDTLKVSIIIPSKNSENTIEGALDFWLRQDFDNIEIIVVDDSSDKTLDIVRKKAKKSKKPIKIFKGNRSGPSYARNLGLKKSKGDIIIFSDSDVSMESFDSTFLSRVVLPFHNGAEVVYIDYEPFTGGGLLRSLINIKSAGMYRKANSHMPAAYLKNIAEKIGGFDTNLQFGEDREFVDRYLKKTEKIAVAEGVKICDNNIHSLSRFSKQAQWYGRTMMKYAKKTGNYLPVMKVIFLSLSLLMLPFYFLNPIFSIPFLLALIIVTAIVYVKLGLKYFPMSLLIPFLEIYHSFFVFIGLIKQLNK